MAIFLLLVLFFVAENPVLPPGRKLGQSLIPCSLRGSETIGFAVIPAASESEMIYCRV
ncbi:hypothetical protein D1AOALGA4SA_10542 [Olavius algarvensis Delta 1 endosymbiont]|nr:hypothetical protein D1AOALGA4SA_10542 [Olavius algarvensis Delta 1 endosymbiont]